MQWYHWMLIVIAFLAVNILACGFFAFKMLFGRKPGEGADTALREVPWRQGWAQTPQKPKKGHLPQPAGPGRASRRQ